MSKVKLYSLLFEETDISGTGGDAAQAALSGVSDILDTVQANIEELQKGQKEQTRFLQKAQAAQGAPREVPPKSKGTTGTTLPKPTATAQPSGTISATKTTKPTETPAAAKPDEQTTEKQAATLASDLAKNKEFISNISGEIAKSMKKD